MARLLCALALAVCACDADAEAPSKAPQAQQAGSPQTALGLQPSPKPGERVRQAELDGYCSADGALAFYYHGGKPVVRVARKDQCTPLYLSECEAEGRCYAPRDQEPGMWCCTPRPTEQPAIHATR